MFQTNPTEKMIRDKIQELNQTLVLSDVNIIFGVENYVVVNSNSRIYEQGKIKFSYTVGIALGDVIKNTQLGEFNTQPKAEDILNKVSELNDSFDRTQVMVFNITATQALIITNQDSTIYAQGVVIVNFKVHF